jgi:hypothetical protein
MYHHLPADHHLLLLFLLLACRNVTYNVMQQQQEHDT